MHAPAALLSLREPKRGALAPVRSREHLGARTCLLGSARASQRLAAGAWDAGNEPRGASHSAFFGLLGESSRPRRARCQPLAIVSRCASKSPQWQGGGGHWLFWPTKGRTLAACTRQSILAPTSGHLGLRSCSHPQLAVSSLRVGAPGLSKKNGLPELGFWRICRSELAPCSGSMTKGGGNFVNKFRQQVLHSPFRPQHRLQARGARPSR